MFQKKWGWLLRVLSDGPFVVGTAWFGGKTVATIWAWLQQSLVPTWLFLSLAIVIGVLSAIVLGKLRWLTEEQMWVRIAFSIPFLGLAWVCASVGQSFVPSENLTAVMGKVVTFLGFIPSMDAENTLRRMTAVLFTPVFFGVGVLVERRFFLAAEMVVSQVKNVQIHYRVRPAEQGIGVTASDV